MNVCINNALPSEIFSVIVAELEFDELHRIGQVSRKWRLAVKEDLRKRIFDALCQGSAAPNNIGNLEAINALVESDSLLRCKVVDLSGFSPSDAEAICAISQNANLLLTNSEMELKWEHLVLNADFPARAERIGGVSNRPGCRRVIHGLYRGIPVDLPSLTIVGGAFSSELLQRVLTASPATLTITGVSLRENAAFCRFIETVVSEQSECFGTIHLVKERGQEPFYSLQGDLAASKPSRVRRGFGGNG